MEKFFFKKIELWVLALCLIVGIVGTVLFGWAVQYKAKGGLRGGTVGQVLLDIAEWPTPLVLLLNDAVRAVNPQQFHFADFAGLRYFDTELSDDGYLLVSAWGNEHTFSTVYLYDLKDRKIIHEWTPPVEDILKSTSYLGGDNDLRDYKSQHPFLLENGDIVITSSQGPLARVDACGRLVWTIDRHFHHAIERASNGNLFVPHVIAGPEDFFNDHHADEKSVTVEGHKVAPIRDDGFAEVSPDGRIVREWSVKDILERHGHYGLLYGVGAFEVDRIHLNDAEPILRSDAYVEEGDIALSLRNLSTVMLYRPSTDEIVWLKTGPWLNQHDVDYQGNGVFTIYGNDTVRSLAEWGERPLHGYSSIYEYDQATDRVSTRLSMAKAGIFAPRAGLHTVLPDGDIFVEGAYTMVHRISAAGDIRWSFVSAVGEGKISALNWSRYFSRDGVDLSWIGSVTCD